MTAKTPGITQLVASVSGASSAPYEFTTCFVQAIYLQIAGQGPLGNSTIVNTGASLSITATAIDTLYQFTGVPMPNPPLTWSTTNPDVALFATSDEHHGKQQRDRPDQLWRSDSHRLLHSANLQHRPAGTGPVHSI